MELNFNQIFHFAANKKKWYQKAVYWFCKHYFYCDIHPSNKIHNSVYFAHNAMGVVINQDAIIDENVTIQHHVTIGKTDKGVIIFGGGSILEQMLLLSERSSLEIMSSSELGLWLQNLSPIIMLSREIQLRLSRNDKFLKGILNKLMV